LKILDGVKVLELGSYITAPFCGMLLADLGADVVKIENPNGGDPFRSFNGGLYSAHYVAFNKNKRSVTLDLQTEAGRRTLLGLIERADVLIDNLRPGVIDRLGLGWTVLHERNPRLIHCSITGFGTIGPYRDRPAYDTVATSLSGLLALQLDPDDPVLAGTTIGDNVAGITACYDILAALYERESSNVGRRVEVDMLQSLIACFPGEFAVFSQRGTVMDRFTRAAGSQSWTLRCADGKILAVHLSSPEKFWQNAVRAFERPDLATDPRFGTRMKRVENYLQLTAELRAIVATRPRAYWVSRLDECEVPYAPVHHTDEVIADPQVQALGTFYHTKHPVEGDILAVNRPVYIDGSRQIDDRPPPTLGEHNDEVLAAWGILA